MKSIMEEASSITKAIENAWSRAGNPQEFSIKILEHPTTSFFGLKTAKSAKIALFFQEAPQRTKESARQPYTPTPRGSKAYEPQRRPLPASRTERAERPERARSDEGERPAYQPRAEQRRGQAPRSNRYDESPRESRSSSYGQRTQQRSDERSYDSRESWTPEMVQAAQEWLKETLVMMGKPDIGLNTNVSNNYLKITLAQPVTNDPRQEDTQLKSWGGLAMESVREKVNKPLRSLRIILESRR